MIDPIYAQTMARYNRWQNANLHSLGSTLSEEARRQDRGAFFKSIHATLNHLMWADRLWMSRIAGLAKPAGGIPESAFHIDDWAQLKNERVTFDDWLVGWSDRLDAAEIGGDLTWRSVSSNSQITRPRWFAIVHMFNHQTHHRGQVHAMLTAAGTTSSDTDLIMMR
jgi:uncharacterized damage-inducible protein DinB